MPIQFLSYTYQLQLYECFCGEQRVFQKFILGGSELLYFHSRFLCTFDAMLPVFCKHYEREFGC